MEMVACSMSYKERVTEAALSLHEADLLLSWAMQSWHEQWQDVLLNSVSCRLFHAVMHEADLLLSWAMQSLH